MGIALAATHGWQIPREAVPFRGISGCRRGRGDLFGMARCSRDYVGGTTTVLSTQRLRIRAATEVSWRRCGLWRSLVSALVWGTRGRRFKSSQPDTNVILLLLEGDHIAALVANWS